MVQEFLFEVDFGIEMVPQGYLADRLGDVEGLRVVSVTAVDPVDPEIPGAVEVTVAVDEATEVELDVLLEMVLDVLDDHDEVLTVRQRVTA